MYIEADRALVPSHTPAARYLTVRITAPPRRHPVRQRPAVNVALVLDRSGSMDGRKIEMAREAVAHAIKLLDQRDQFTVVVYDDRVEIVLELTAASSEAKKNALHRLAHIDARGSTDLAGGWFAGARALAAPEATTRVLLLTDGLANAGVTDHDELRKAAASFREQGIATSTFGVGVDFDEELLASIATEGGGHFYFIETAAQIPDLLASELGETLEVVARDAVFDITCGPGVGAIALNGSRVETSDGRLRVRLGDLVADQEITLALAITCGPAAAEQIVFVDCRVTDRDGALFQEPMRVEWRVADAAANQRQPVNRSVLIVVADIIAERERMTALAANRRGNFDEARRVLSEVIAFIETLAPGHDRIAAIIDRLRRDEAEFGHAMDAREMKRSHYRSYTASLSREPSGQAKRRK
jgi:Ca-activated chloride channel family protein